MATESLLRSSHRRGAPHHTLGPSSKGLQGIPLRRRGSGAWRGVAGRGQPGRPAEKRGEGELQGVRSQTGSWGKKDGELASPLMSLTSAWKGT